jgi:hypothetical protein
MHSYLTAHCAFARDRSRIVRSPFAGRFPFSASPLRSRLANASGRIEFIIVLFMDWSFASGCSPPRLSTTQLPSATDRPVLLSDEDFHPIVGAYFQAHIGVGTKVSFAPPSEPDWQISCIRLSSWWLTFKKIGKPQRTLVLRKTSQPRRSRYLAIGVDRPL